MRRAPSDPSDKAAKPLGAPSKLPRLTSAAFAGRAALLMEKHGEEGGEEPELCGKNSRWRPLVREESSRTLRRCRPRPFRCETRDLSRHQS